jgi:uncharacterized membrane protein YedE/YeeE
MREGAPVVASRVRVVVIALVVGLVLAAPEIAFAEQNDQGAYPHVIDQTHIGRRCTHEDIVVAGGTIVGVGGQVVAGGGGTGVGCDTFVAYEFRSGQPSSRQPFVEPGYTLRPRPGAAEALTSAPAITS